MVFKRQSDKQSYENQNHNMQTEPYMAMPQVGRPSVNHQQQGQSSHSRAMTGPLHDPRKDVPAQHPSVQNSMYNNQYAGQMPIYPQQPPYLNAYGAPQQQSSAMNQQYARPQQQNIQNNRYTPLNPPEDLKGLSFWQEDTEHNYHDEAEDNNDGASPIKFVLTILALVVFSVILWLGYRFATQPQNTHIPLIQADPGIYKHRPENPGGEYFPHQDMQVYNRLTPHQQTMVQQERILPQDYAAYPTQEEIQQQEYYQQQGYDQQQQNYAVQDQEFQYNQSPYYQNQNPGQPAAYAQQSVETPNLPQQTSAEPVVQQQPTVAPIVAPVQETIPSVAEVKQNLAEQTVSASDKKMGVVDPDSVFVESEKKQVNSEKSEPIQSKPLTAGYYMQLGGMLPSYKSAET
ncbi:MAG TPA: hypothetical protein DIC42_00375, partial [Holosporales bacterium]|nr:hypothetical protein [Holosporales bacterium]